jgi:TolA-binding protein
VGWYRLGQSRQDAGKFDEAIDAFAKARAAKPQGSRAPWALLATGWCHESQKRLPEAIKAWSELISAHPDSAAASSALLARGDARYRTGDFAGGGADAERILDLVAKGSAKLDPAATGEARLLQGLCLSSEKKYAQAAAAFQKLLQEQPNFPAADRALFELGLAQTLGDKPADATPTFETLVKRFPKSSQAADAWLEIGEARWKAENWPESGRGRARGAGPSQTRLDAPHAQGACPGRRELRGPGEGGARGTARGRRAGDAW